MNNEDIIKLIDDMNILKEIIGDNPEKEAEFKEKYGITSWPTPQSGGLPKNEWPKNKTPWMDDIRCRLFPHTYCHGEKDPEKKKKTDKKDDKNDDKKATPEKTNTPDSKENEDPFKLPYVDTFSEPLPPTSLEKVKQKIQNTTKKIQDTTKNIKNNISTNVTNVTNALGITKKGGYENYIGKARKTRRKRLVKKGKRKNKTYHRRVSV